MKAGSLKQPIALFIAMSMLLAACTPTAQPGRTTAGIGQGVIPPVTPPPVANPVEAPPKVEIRNLVEPNITTSDYPSYFTGTGLVGAGTYVRKLTLPQNYGGFLYLGGLNITSLKNRFISVRFTFGVSGTQITVPATVSRAPGITPNTDIDVLVMDLRSKPFNTIRLLYDLYDYKDYSLDSEPVETNRDQNLYCRSLKLQDDPTFNGQGACDGFAADGVSPLVDENGDPVTEKCLYSYAKVLDRGLAKGSGTTFSETFPTIKQTDYTSGHLGYYAQTTSNLLNRCLPDKSLDTSVTVVDGVSAITRVDDLFFSFFNEDKNLIQRDASNAIIFNQPVKYLGPFKPINTANWETSRDAVFGEFGLFDYIPAIYPPGTFPEQMDNMQLHRSKLFPRFAKQPLGINVSYLETDLTDLNSKVPVTMAANGVSGVIDGCSTRVESVTYDGYHIGSCNASGKIEILARDDNNVEYIVAETNEVTLQLVRSTQINGQGNEYLYSNFKTCQNNSQCGGDECCFNKRCWNNGLVAQCIEDTTPSPNLLVGEACGNDLECASLCCNRSTGLCAVHDTNVGVLCNKPQGQFCLATEWCAKSTVQDCYIIDDGTDPDTGAALCHKQCYPVQSFGQCKNNVCQAPAAGKNPPFNPNAVPLDCSAAVPAPDFSGN